MTWVIKNTNTGKEREVESRAEAEETRDNLISIGASPDQLEIVPPKASDGGTETKQPEVVDEPEPAPEPAENETVAVESIPENPPIDQDPITWLPEHFIDSIQGVPTINRKGYCVIASAFDISVTSEPVTLASETEFEYAEFKAVATTDDGQEYSGFGSAHVDRQDGDDAYLLNELAETRAMKRAVAWSSGVGLTAAEELQGEL